MVDYEPVRSPIIQRRLAQTPALLSVPPPMPDFLFTGYDGVVGFLEGVLVLSATTAGAWIGIRTGLDKKANKIVRSAGWVGGVGAGLAGLLYIGGRSGLNQMVGLPAVRVTPS